MPWDLNTKTVKSPFEKAIRENSVLLLKRQISSGNILQNSDLLYAIDGRYEALQFLLESGLNPNVLDTAGKNLLFHVADIKALAIILEKVQDINHQDFAGDTILHHLVRDYPKKKELGFIELCLSRKPDLSVRNKRGQTALLSIFIPKLEPVFDKHVLMSRRMSEFFILIDRLLASGSSLSECDSDGNTLLHRVCQTMLVDKYLQTTIQELVRRGASIHSQNARGLNILAQVLAKIDIERKETIGDPVTYVPAKAQSLSSGAAALFPDDRVEDTAYES